MSTPSENRVSHLSWDKVATRIEAGAAAVLPIGAGAKEHGLHLPMNTDQLQAEWFSGIIAGETDALVWPTLTYGFYPAFVHYAGSASLKADTFAAAVSEIVAGILSFGASPVLIVNTGVSTIPPIDRLLGQNFTDDPVVHLKVYEGPRFAAAVSELSEQSGGTHADEIETSMILALYPELVRMERAQASPPAKGGAPEPLSPNDPDAANYSPGGSWGDPTLASAEKGKRLLKALAEDVAEMARHAVGDS